MALDPRISLGVNADIGGALNNAILSAERIQGLRQRRAIEQQNALLRPIIEQQQRNQLQLQGQQVQQGQQGQLLSLAQRGITAFERGDSAGVESAIGDMFSNDPQRKQSEIAEFRANPQQYINEARDVVATARSSQQMRSGAERFSPTTENLPGGLTKQTTSTGRVIFRDSSGRELSGVEAEQAVVSASKFRTAEQMEIAGGKKRAVDEEARSTSLINRGISAAESTATIRRGLELLDSVKTGGFESASLRARQLFGIEGADEGELSNNLGIAVLSQLKETFGSAFTEAEGARLERLSASFGKSPAANKRILQQALRITERTAKRARSAAVKRGDNEAVSDIDDLLSFDLGVDNQGLKVGELSDEDIAKQLGL